MVIIEWKNSDTYGNRNVSGCFPVRPPYRVCRMGNLRGTGVVGSWIVVESESLLYPLGCVRGDVSCLVPTSTVHVAKTLASAATQDKRRAIGAVGANAERHARRTQAVVFELVQRRALRKSFAGRYRDVPLLCFLLEIAIETVYGGNR